MRFVSFHTHTTYSYGDGFGPVRAHVQRVVELGMSALFLSEHGNVNSHAALEQECREAGIKPGFGIEAYLSPADERSKTHITLFAMDEEGYRNLNRIVTESYINFKQFPTVTWESLVKHNAGIVAFSGCADSLISCTLLGGKFLGPKRDPREGISPQSESAARRKIERFIDVFGTDRFFLEVQRFSGLDRTCALNPTLARLSIDTGVPLIATADVHYPRPTDNKMQTTLHASRRGSSVAVSEASWEYDILLTYPESDQEVIDDLQATGLSEQQAHDALEATTNLAARCTVELPKAKPLTYSVPVDFKDRGVESYFRERIKDGLSYRMGQRADIAERLDEYKRQINFEFKIIREKGFMDYFLALADLVVWTKDQDITVGPARGSAAASLVCYLLRITEIDPLHPIFSRMVFERFLDPTRTDPPDIDLDFDDENRWRTIERAVEVYGKPCVAAVGNHIKYRGKKALEGITKAYALPASTFKPIADRITDRTETDERVDDSIQDVLESYASDPEIAALIAEHADKLAQAMALEGNQHSMGIHAAGFVFASEPISDVCALYTREKGSGRNSVEAQVIPYEKRDAEYVGFLKMDFLGLKAMGMITRVRRMVGMDLDTLYSMFYKHYNTYVNERIMESFLVDDVVGIFQYEGSTTRSLMRRLQPETFDHLAAVGALSRPGPYYGGQADEYIAVKNGEKDWERIHPNFDKHVEWTYGQIVYQEQIMWILRDVAGFDVVRVLRVRKIIGKKLGEHQFATLWDEFREGCNRTSNLSEETANRIWSAITTAAGYAFNIPHAYSYGLVAWWQQYFKVYEVAPFFAATLAKNGDGKKQIPRRTLLLQDAQKHHLNIEGFENPSAMAVTWRVLGDDKTLQPGFSQIPGVGPATAQDIEAWLYGPRERPDVGAYDRITWEDLQAVKGIGPKTVLKFKEIAQLPDPLGINRTRDQLETFRFQLENGEFDGSGLPGADEYVVSNELESGDPAVCFVGLVNNIVFRDEVETAYSRTGRPLAELRQELEAKYNGNTKKATVFAFDEFGEVALRFSAWTYPRFAEQLTGLDPDKHMVVVFGRTYDRNNAIQVRALWILDLD